MKKVFGVINKVEVYFLASSFAVVIAVIFLQVVLRFLGITNSWSEELARYLFIWECWVGISFCERYNEHIKITFIVDRLKGIPKNIVEIISNAGCAVFAAVLAYYGIQMVSHLFTIHTSSPSIGIPMWIVYLSLPAGCIVYMARTILNIYGIITGKKVHEEWK